MSSIAEHHDAGVVRQGPPPFVSSGGLNAIAKSQTGFAEADLQTGRYMLFCMIPDPDKNGARHITLGMIKEITVK